MAVKLPRMLCNMMMTMVMVAAMIMTVLKVVQCPQLAHPQTLAVLLLNQVYVLVGVYASERKTLRQRQWVHFGITDPLMVVGVC